MEFLRLYRAEEWDVFREKILELDGYSCQRCHRGTADGAILQVHHLEYQPGRLPWDYSPSACETVCKGCHAQIHGKIRPSVGWELLGREDSGDLCENCENCGTDIRYVFHIWHPAWESMAVGEICCDHLTGTEIASNFIESQRRFQSRLRRFLESPRWKTGPRIAAIRQSRIEVQIYEFAPSNYRIHMNGREGKRTFTELDAAKRLVFNVIEDGTADRFLTRPPQGH
jgi:hypothetical protein